MLTAYVYTLRNRLNTISSHSNVKHLLLKPFIFNSLPRVKLLRTVFTLTIV